MRGVPRERAARAVGRVVVDRDVEQARRAAHDGRELRRAVVVEPVEDAEARAQRRGEQAGAGGGADQREARQVEAQRARRGPLAEDDVELEVLHRRIEHLLDGAVEAVDLVDEQHVVRLEGGQHRREVALALEHRAAGDVEAHAQLGRPRCPASDVLPRPGGPARSTWSSASPRWRAASRKIASCCLTASCPMKSSSRRGRSELSSSSSAPMSSPAASALGPSLGSVPQASRRSPAPQPRPGRGARGPRRRGRRARRPGRRRPPRAGSRGPRGRRGR